MHRGDDPGGIDLRTIRPLDIEALLRSTHKTHRVVVAEEGWAFAGVGAQVVDTIQREAFDELDAPILRACNLDVPMPYNAKLEQHVIPQAPRIIEKVHAVLYKTP